MKLDSMKQLLISEILDLRDAEKQVVDALPEIERAANSAQLREALARQRQAAVEHFNRATTALRMLDSGAGNGDTTCKTMQGLVSETRDLISTEGDMLVRDAALVAAVQRMEHFEIASYGSAIAFAKRVNEPEVAKLLKQNLNEAKKADKELTKLAEGSFFRKGLNQQAGQRS